MTHDVFTWQSETLKQWLFDHYTDYLSLPLPKIERAQLEEWPFFHLNPSLPTADLKIEHAHESILICDWETAIQQHEDLFKKYLFKVIDPSLDRLSAFQLAHLNRGVFIYVPENYQAEEIFEWVQDFDPAPHQYLLLVLGKGSQLTFFERLSQAQIANHSLSYTVEVVLEEGAQLHYMAIDQIKTQQASYIRRHALVQNQATIQWSIGSFNDGATIIDLDTHLKGQGSQAYLSEVAISNKNNRQVLDSKINNYGSHSIGHIYQHGVALDQGTLTVNGIGKIHKRAKAADAQQENRLLMLSDQARGDANPILLIDEFEVTAGHAASVAKVDDSQLWYLMTRGIDRQQAEYLVIRGFLMRALNKIKDPITREMMVHALDAKLSSLPTGGSHD